MGICRGVLAVLLAASAVLATGCSSEPDYPTYTSVAEWCDDYKILISENAGNLAVWASTENGLPLNDSESMAEANRFREEELAMVKSAGELGMFSEKMVADRIRIDEEIFEPTLNTLEDAGDQLAGIGTLVAERKFIEFVDEVNSESQSLGYRDADDFLSSYGYQVSARCGFDVQEIVDSFPI